MKSTQPPQLIGALDKKNQLMKIAGIQPPMAIDASSEKVTEFKLNMSQFSVVDIVDFFNQTSELICLDLINTYVYKEKLQRDFKKLERKLKTESVEKKSRLIKKEELEKKIIEINKNTGNETFNSIIQEKGMEILNLKNKLKMPHEAHVQTAELKTVFQEKEVLENELRNTKAIVGTFKNKKEEMENKI